MSDIAKRYVQLVEAACDAVGGIEAAGVNGWEATRSLEVAAGHGDAGVGRPCDIDVVQAQADVSLHVEALRQAHAKAVEEARALDRVVADLEAMVAGEVEETLRAALKEYVATTPMKAIPGGWVAWGPKG